MKSLQSSSDPIKTVIQLSNTSAETRNLLYDWHCRGVENLDIEACIALVYLRSSTFTDPVKFINATLEFVDLLATKQLTKTELYFVLNNLSFPIQDYFELFQNSPPDLTCLGMAAFLFDQTKRSYAMPSTSPKMKFYISAWDQVRTIVPPAASTVAQTIFSYSLKFLINIKTAQLKISMDSSQEFEQKSENDALFIKTKLVIQLKAIEFMVSASPDFIRNVCKVKRDGFDMEREAVRLMLQILSGEMGGFERLVKEYDAIKLDDGQNAFDIVGEESTESIKYNKTIENWLDNIDNKDPTTLKDQSVQTVVAVLY
jgi:hypothetical protein